MMGKHNYPPIAPQPEPRRFTARPPIYGDPEQWETEEEERENHDGEYYCGSCRGWVSIKAPCRHFAPIWK
jgi:hypothetical protein